MFRRYFFPILAVTLLLVSSALLASAQSGQLRGHVVMKLADGTNAPVADATVDVFRTDISGKYSTKTDKKGQFVFAGIPYVGTYVIAVSKADAQPNWLPDVKAGRDFDYEIDLKPGDGRRLTLEEIKAAKGPATASTASGAVSAEEKARLEEMERKNAEIAAKNEKAKNANEVIARTFKAGNEALEAKKYDEAIKQYEEGLAADAEQPAILTNEAIAYKARGVERYNASVTAKDDASRASNLEGAKSDFRAAAAAATKAATLVKSAPAGSDAASQTRFNSNKLAALSVQAESMRLFVSKVDPTQADAGLAAFKDYIAFETDPAKKAKAQVDAAQMLLDAGAVDKAYAEFQTILATQPDNVDASLGAGLALFASGDKTKYQQAANYLQHYVDVAPDSHKFKADAKAILAELKNTEKVVPEKAPARRRRP